MFVEKETSNTALRAADDARKVALQNNSSCKDLNDVIRIATLKIERAVEHGELECEIEVEPGLDWSLCDLLCQCGYSVRRARRGVLSVSWA